MTPGERQAKVQEATCPVEPGARVLFDAPRTGWCGTSHGPHVNADNDVLVDLIDVVFDRDPATVYLCKRSLLAPVPAREEGTT